MKIKAGLCNVLMVMTYVFALCLTSINYANAASAEGAGKILSFNGVDYIHRWSKNGQNEFTPNGEADLATWKNMVTVNAYEIISNGEQLAKLANNVLSSYQANGKLLRSDSKPQTAERPAEHFISAVLGDSGVLEATFTRFILVDGVGTVVLYSHRVYGKNSGPDMAEWLKANGAQVESALMAWNDVPHFADLKRLPQSQD